ncbi:DNA polymerase IV [Angustibacter peucedani]
MRDRAEILHLDLDSFFAAVEQRDKPSLRGKPVVVGGVGGRGVVSTASYEARVFGVRSAMSVAEARRRCPNAAYLSTRFEAYRVASRAVMAELHAASGLVEQLSIDEAYADLAVAAEEAEPATELAALDLVEAAKALRRRVSEVTGGLTASVGLAPSRSVAKLASEAAKPDGLLVVEPADVRAFLDPLPVSAIGGVGPATLARLQPAGIRTVADLAAMDDDDAVRLLGSAHGRGLLAIARGDDERPVVAYREAKSISAEETFETDLRDPLRMGSEVDVLAARVAHRLRREGLAGRTVTLKIRFADFSIRTRSYTAPEATDSTVAVGRAARRLLAEVDTLAWSTAGGVRLLGVGVSGLADWVQPDLLAPPEAVEDVVADDEPADEPVEPGGTGGAGGGPAQASQPDDDGPRSWRPGADVRHDEHGAGWVWGSGLGRVTVRFEGPATPPGPVRTFASDDPQLHPADPPDPLAP